jgi:amino acid transporter
MASFNRDVSTVSKITDKQKALSTEKDLPSEKYIPVAMPQILGTWDMTTTFVVSIYLPSCAVTAATGGPAALTYLLLTGIAFFIPCLIATKQLGVMFPFEGALYNWTHKALGGYWSTFSGFCAWFPGVLISSSLANLFITYIHEMNPDLLTTSWQQGIAISIILIFAGIACTQRFCTIQKLINILVCLMFIGSLLVILSTIIWLATGHSSVTNFTHQPDWYITPQNISLFGLVAFAYLGTDGPLNMAGETTGNHVIRRHLFWGALIIFVAYITNTLGVLIVATPEPGGYTPFTMVELVEKVLGKPFGSITATCFMASFIATVLAYNYIYARLLLVASIDRHLPTSLGKLNKHRVPANAILLQTVLGVLFTVLVFVIAPLATPHENQVTFALVVYSISQAAATLVWAISTAFLFINLIACYLRNRQQFLKRRVFPLPVLWVSTAVGSLSCLLTIVDTLFFSWIPQVSNGQWWYLVGSLTLIFLTIAVVGSLIANSEAYWQDFHK